MQPPVREGRLFTYEVASADMYVGAVTERTIYLRNDPALGPVVRGELCDGRPECYINLSHVLLEYALNCEGCQDPNRAGTLIDCMAERVGRILAARLYQDAPDTLQVDDRISGAFQFILRSMGISFEMHRTDGGMRFDLGCCSLHETAQTRGLSHAVPLAHRGFVTLCESVLQTLEPGWQMVQPTKEDASAQLVPVILKRIT